MTRRSGRLQGRSENAPIHRGKITKQNNKKKTLTLLKRQNEIQSQLVLEGVHNPCVLIETPVKEVEMTCEEPSYETLTSSNLSLQPSPLPLLSWGCPNDVWEKMLIKELKYTHSKSFLEQHPRIQPRMRAILLDWLLEVSEVYTLHRQTFYLAQDYFDRFMSTQVDVAKDRLQLIGITSLFIASKIEEIHPPKLHELAYVTDGACQEEEILQMELIVLKALSWRLCPETLVSWLKLYIQMASLSDLADVLRPQFPQEEYVQVTRLLDLCILDINSLDFEYSVLAASALCHFLPYEVVGKACGLRWEDMESCIDWMAPFVETVAGWSRVELKDFAKVTSDDRHNIQTHTEYLSMLDEAKERGFESQLESQLLTPPNSTEKPTSH